MLKSKIIDRVSIDLKRYMPENRTIAASTAGGQLPEKRLTFDNICLTRLPQAKKWQGLARLAIQLRPILEKELRIHESTVCCLPRASGSKDHPNS